MSKYLYGAAVQGIQDFIFKTNNLKEIVGASVLIEDICTDVFAKQLSYNNFDEMEDDSNAILNAAGNIKYVFNDKEKCQKVFLEFPKKVSESAPGITFSQAVVEFEDSDNFSTIVDELERRLRKERNRPTQPLTIGLMGIQRSRETGLPERWHTNMPFFDEGTYQKLMALESDKRAESSLRKKAMGDLLKDTMFGDTDNISFFSGDNNWIAIIHADGNGLGQVVKRIGETDKGGKDFHTFSNLLNKATIASAQEAVQKALDLFKGKEKDKEKTSKFFPFRPIVLGGDDLTVIIRGDLAIEFTKNFLTGFERNTKNYFAELAEKYTLLRYGLTACAGIAFIKSSFPYYYGYRLAESLCQAAKDDTKKEGRDKIKSCLMFHKVQDSFVESYKEIINRELTTPDGHSFNYGPYYPDNSGLNSDKRWTIAELMDACEIFETGENGNALRSDIRQWLSAMMEFGGTEKAKQLKERLLSINTENTDWTDKLTNESVRNVKANEQIFASPAYDVLSLHSIIYQQIKD